MNNRKAIVLNDKSVKTIGRTYLYNDTLWAAFSGAGAEFIFTGKNLKLPLRATLHRQRAMTRIMQESQYMSITNVL